MSPADSAGSQVAHRTPGRACQLAKCLCSPFGSNSRVMNSRHDLTPDEIGLVRLEPHAVDRDVRIRVVAKVKSRIQLGFE
jgi:hypothetical protein